LVSFSPEIPGLGQKPGRGTNTGATRNFTTGLFAAPGGLAVTPGFSEIRIIDSDQIVDPQIRGNTNWLSIPRFLQTPYGLLFPKFALRWQFRSDFCDFDFFKVFPPIFTLFFPGNVVLAASSLRFPAPETMQNTPNALFGDVAIRKFSDEGGGAGSRTIRGPGHGGKNTQ